MHCKNFPWKQFSAVAYSVSIFTEIIQTWCVWLFQVTTSSGFFLLTSMLQNDTDYTELAKKNWIKIDTEMAKLANYPIDFTKKVQKGLHKSNLFFIILCSSTAIYFIFSRNFCLSFETTTVLLKTDYIFIEIFFGCKVLAIFLRKDE